VLQPFLSTETPLDLLSGTLETCLEVTTLTSLPRYTLTAKSTQQLVLKVESIVLGLTYQDPLSLCRARIQIYAGLLATRLLNAMLGRTLFLDVTNMPTQLAG
jgi:hypothetical protein